MNQQISDYIAANRQRYTRDAITQQLEAAGHPREAIDAAWDRSASTEAGAAPDVPAGATKSQKEASAPPGREAMVLYVVLWFVAGAMVDLLLNAQPAYLIAYLVVGAIAAFLMTRVRVSGWGWLLAIPLVPAAFFLVWYGTCLAVYQASY